MHFVVTANTSFNIANYRAGLVKRLMNEGHKVTVVAPIDDYTDQVHKFDCGFREIKLSQKGQNPFIECLVIFQYWRIFRELSPDAVFSFTAKSNLYAGIAARFCSITSLPTVTGLGVAFYGGAQRVKIVKLLYRVAFRRAAKVFFQNPEDRHQLLSLRLLSQQQAELVGGSGVDANYFSFAPFSKCHEAKKSFLMITRLLRQKGVEEFCNAARTLSKKYPTVEFRIAGAFDEGNPDSISPKELEEFRREGTVEYLGHVRDVRPIISAATAVVLPSYYNEGTPRSLLEAGAMGRPLITTDHRGCRDTVLPNKSGFLIPPKCTDSLVSAMEKFIEMSFDEIEVIGQASHNFIVANFAERDIIDAYSFAVIEASST